VSRGKAAHGDRQIFLVQMLFVEDVLGFDDGPEDIWLAILIPLESSRHQCFFFLQLTRARWVKKGLT